MANDKQVLDLLPSLTLEQAEAVERLLRDCDEQAEKDMWAYSSLRSQADVAEKALDEAEETVEKLTNEAAVLRLQVADLQRALSLANIKLGGIAMLLQGK